MRSSLLHHSQSSRKLPNLLLPPPRLPTQNHNRELFSKGDANFKKRFFPNELNFFVVIKINWLLFFFRADKKIVA